MKIPEKKRYSGKYDPKLKIAIAHEYLTTDQGYTTLSRKYNIPKTSILDFVTWYKKKYPTGVEDIPDDTALPENNNGATECDLKIIALELLIENASKELGIDLVKKFGTKQPKK